MLSNLPWKDPKKVKSKLNKPVENNSIVDFNKTGLNRFQDCGTGLILSKYYLRREYRKVPKQAQFCSYNEKKFK